MEATTTKEKDNMNTTHFVDIHEVTTGYSAKYADDGDEQWILAHAGERVLVQHDPLETPGLEWTYGKLYPGYIERIDYNAPGLLTHVALLLPNDAGVVSIAIGNVHSMRTNATDEDVDFVMA